MKFKNEFHDILLLTKFIHFLKLIG